jgi:PAS domain S-box-containing protein
MRRPEPINEEIELDPKKYIVSKTDPKGIITYGNDYFTEISRYTADELIGKPHNILRHPDMPKVIFKLVWDRIQAGETVYGLIKNLAKDGRYYWVFSEFVPNKTSYGVINGYTAYRQAASKKAVIAIEPLYRKLREIEDQSGIEGSEAYLKGFLEEEHTTYDKYIDKITGNGTIMKMFFKMMKKLFGGDEHH